MVRFLTTEQLTTHSDAIKDGRCVLLDVRERREYEAGHIPQALSTPLSQIEVWIDDLDRNREVIAYCHTGKRSRRCAEFLVSQGFRQVYTMEGGLNAWNMAQPRP
jgi:rhodanese-related sulfurtransferase